MFVRAGWKTSWLKKNMEGRAGAAGEVFGPLVPSGGFCSETAPSSGGREHDMSPLHQHLIWSKTHLRDALQFLHWGVNVTPTQISYLNSLLKCFVDQFHYRDRFLSHITWHDIKTESLAASSFLPLKDKTSRSLSSHFVFELSSFKLLLKLDLLVLDARIQS